MKTTFDAGYLVPCYVDEALPGDTFKLKMTAFARLATPIYPIMDNMFLDTHFFSVPVRLLWDNWQKFNGEQINPGDSIDFQIPIMDSATGYANQTLHDYLSIPTLVANLEHSSLWHRAYNLIYNEWYRDENLIDSVTVDTDDGPDAPADYVLLRRGKRRDYFTSSLPWPQKGDSVELPLGTAAPIHTGQAAGSNISVYSDQQTAWKDLTASGASVAVGTTGIAESAQLYADLSAATAATMNQFLQAQAIQSLLVRDARGGTRYTEIIRAHWGVVSPDARLQRPEYLGGGTSAVNVNAVAQQSSTDGTSPQGNLAGIGTVVVNGHGFTKSFTEHCILLGIMSVRADLTYQQGLNRMFSRSTRYDFFWPALANIGEQAILNKEIYAQGTAADDNVFGYIPRYDEYRYKPSVITGKLRSNDAASLDPWHLSQDFTTLPVLDETFINETPPISRVVAVNTEPDFIFDSYFDLRCARGMPMYSVPGLSSTF